MRTPDDRSLELHPKNWIIISRVLGLEGKFDAACSVSELRVALSGELIIVFDEAAAAAGLRICRRVICTEDGMATE